MYERFTDRARKVMQLANHEAQRFRHEYIGTEHILLGLIKEGSGVAANVMKNLDLDVAKVRSEVEKIVYPGPNPIEMGKMPQTPRAKKASNTPLSNLVTSSTTMSAPSTCCSVSCAKKKESLRKFS